MKLPGQRQVFIEPVAPKNLPDINFADQINRGLAAHNEAAQNVVSSWQQAKEESETRNAVATATERSESARVEYDTLLTNARNQSKQDGSDLNENGRKLWDEYEQRQLDGLTGKAAEITRQKLQPIRQQFLAQINATGLEMGNKYRIDAINKSIDAAMIAAESNPRSFLASQQNLTEAIDTAGFSPDVAENVKTQMRERLASATLLGDIRRDPYKVLKAMDKRDAEGRTGNVVIDYLPLDQQIKLRNQAEAEARAREAERKQAMALARMELGQKEQNALLSYSMFGTYDNPPNRMEFIAAYGPEEGLKRYESFAKFQLAATETLKYNEMDDKSILADVAASEPKPGGDVKEQLELYKVKQQRAKAIIDMRAKDPVGYLSKTNPAVAQVVTGLTQVLSDPNIPPEAVAGATKAYVNTVRAAKESIGLTSGPVLPASMAEQIASSSFQKGQNAVQQLNAYRERFGPAWSDIAPDVLPKLSDSFKVAMSGMDPYSGARLVELQGAKTEELRKFAPEGITPTMIKRQLDNNFAPLVRSFADQPGGLEAMDLYKDQAERLALSYMASGSSYKDAIDRASQEVIKSRYEVREIGSRTSESYIRIPLTIQGVPADPNLLADGVRALEEKLDLPRLNETKWNTLADDSGVGLYWMGAPVADENGRPIRYSWDEVMRNSRRSWIAPELIEGRMRGGL